jgi:hypothetical protein
VVFVNFKGLSYHLTGGTDKKYYTATNAYLQIPIKPIPKIKKNIGGLITNPVAF